MKIQNKIIRFNIIMVVSIILLMLGFTYIYWVKSGVQYHEVFEAFLDDTDYMYSAKGFLEAYREEIVKIIEEGKEDSISKIEKSIKLQKYEKQITDIGYHYSVKVDNKLFFDNLTEEERKREIKDDNQQVQDFMLQEKDGTTIIETFSQKGGVNIEMFAVHEPQNHPNPFHISLRTIVEKCFFVLGGMMLIVMLLCNVLYTIWIKRNILFPLYKLQKGTKKISEGNLEYELTIEQNDEIGEVCKEFDHMRLELKEAEEKRKRYEKNRAEILAGISHDLRSPLTSIKGYAEGILDGIANTQEKIEKYCRAILIRAYDMERLSDSLGIYMSLSTDKYQFHMERTDINAFIRKYISRNEENDFMEQNVFVRMHLLSEELIVNLDENQMKRVFQNLIQNSVKYRIKDCSYIDFTTDLKKKNDINERKVYISIADDGPGVDGADLENIFDCFFREDDSRTKPEKGSGLGLSIVKKIVEEHGGQVYAQNNNGLVIIIELPLVKE